MISIKVNEGLATWNKNDCWTCFQKSPWPLPSYLKANYYFKKYAFDWICITVVRKYLQVWKTLYWYLVFMFYFWCGGSANKGNKLFFRWCKFNSTDYTCNSHRRLRPLLLGIMPVCDSVLYLRLCINTKEWARSHVLKKKQAASFMFHALALKLG